MKKTLYKSGVRWESVVGYSRAVRIGSKIFVSGTTATDENGDIVGKDNPSLQARQTLANIKTALEALGGKFDDVVRTRMYVTDITKWEAIGQEHGRVFRGIDPATTMVEVSSLINPDMLVEIEAEAHILDSD